MNNLAVANRATYLLIALYAYIVLRVGVYSAAYDATSSAALFYVCQPIVAIPLAVWLAMGPRHWIIRVPSVAFSLVLIVSLFNLTRLMIPEDNELLITIAHHDFDLLTQFTVSLLPLGLLRILGFRIGDSQWRQSQFVTRQWMVGMIYFGLTMVMVQFYFPSQELQRAARFFIVIPEFGWVYCAFTLVPALCFSAILVPLLFRRDHFWPSLLMLAGIAVYALVVAELMGLTGNDTRYISAVVFQGLATSGFFFALRKLGFDLTIGEGQQMSADPACTLTADATEATES